MPSLLHLLRRKPRECDVPPEGWRCTRERGHDGPCAAIPTMLLSEREEAHVRLHPDVRYAAADLPCDGCAHSASGAPFPGHPSGERPCGFCKRNPNLDPDLGLDPTYAPGPNASEGVKCPECDGEGCAFCHQSGWKVYPWPAWYDGEQPDRWPLDNYIATDRLTESLRMQQRKTR